MTFASEPPIVCGSPSSDAHGGDENQQEAPCLGGSLVAALDPDVYQDMRWCANCGGERMFVYQYECEFGRVGVCMGCEEVKLVPFSRMTEAA